MYLKTSIYVLHRAPNIAFDGINCDWAKKKKFNGNLLRMRLNKIVNNNDKINVFPLDEILQRVIIQTELRLHTTQTD